MQYKIMNLKFFNFSTTLLFFLLLSFTIEAQERVKVDGVAAVKVRDGYRIRSEVFLKSKLKLQRKLTFMFSIEASYYDVDVAVK